MEPTYYWDALSPEARQWLKENTLPGRTIDFRGFPHSWLYLRRVGELPRQLAPVDRGVPQWVVLQNRPGAFSDADRALVAGGHAAYEVRKLGVPLIWIFPYTDLAAIGRAGKEVGEKDPERARRQIAVHPLGAAPYGERSRSRLRDADDRARIGGRSAAASVLSRGLWRGCGIVVADRRGRCAGHDDRGGTSSSGRAWAGKAWAR